jgi:hypothetical protein
MPGADCFHDIDLCVDRSVVSTDPLVDTRAFEVVCP